MGRERHPKATRLMITADGGCSNGYLVRLWKIELQNLANELKFPITVCHLPPGTSKWNKIEHRLFAFISGKPLRTYRTIVQLIAATTTNAGLKVRPELDRNSTPKASKSPMHNSAPSTSLGTRFMAIGTTRSRRTADAPSDFLIYGRVLSDLASKLPPTGRSVCAED